MIIREQEAAGVCYLCANHSHTSVDCPRLKSGVPQIEAERMGKCDQSTVNMQNLPRLYKTRKEPIQDSGATVHQAAGAGLWHHVTKQKPPRKRNKKVARNHGNVNWQGIRHNDVDAVNQAFGANKGRSSISPLKLSVFSGRLIVSSKRFASTLMIALLMCKVKMV
jgi:hypothetical protein